jgi:signal transduction histidine kinase
VHAGAARLLQQRDPEAASVALTTVEEVARETIGEIDQLIRGLREDQDGDEDEAVEPPIGLAALETLAERQRASGLPVQIAFEGARRPLAPGLDQAAYRIVQESLTNAARHGTGGAEVEIAYGTRGLDLTISNPVVPSAVSGGLEGWHGILGMRERSALLGGSLDVVVGGGWFRVHARLPYVGEQEPG